MAGAYKEPGELKVGRETIQVVATVRTLKPELRDYSTGTSFVRYYCQMKSPLCHHA